MTPELFNKISQRHQIEEELWGRKQSEAKWINPINLQNFRKLSTLRKQWMIKHSNLLNPVQNNEGIAQSRVDMNKVPTDYELLEIVNQLKLDSENINLLIDIYNIWMEFKAKHNYKWKFRIMNERSYWVKVSEISIIFREQKSLMNILI